MKAVFSVTLTCLSFCSSQLYEHCRVSTHIWSALLFCKGTVLLLCRFFSFSHMHRTPHTFFVHFGSLITQLGFLHTWWNLNFYCSIRAVFFYLSLTFPFVFLWVLHRCTAVPELFLLCYRTSRGSHGGWVWAIKASFSMITRTKLSPGRWDNALPDLSTAQTKPFFLHFLNSVYFTPSREFIQGTCCFIRKALCLSLSFFYSPYCLLFHSVIKCIVFAKRTNNVV